MRYWWHRRHQMEKMMWGRWCGCDDHIACLFGIRRTNSTTSTSTNISVSQKMFFGACTTWFAQTLRAIDIGMYHFYFYLSLYFVSSRELTAEQKLLCWAVEISSKRQPITLAFPSQPCRIYCHLCALRFYATSMNSFECQQRKRSVWWRQQNLRR